MRISRSECFQVNFNFQKCDKNLFQECPERWAHLLTVWRNGSRVRRENQKDGNSIPPKDAQKIGSFFTGRMFIPLFDYPELKRSTLKMNQLATRNRLIQYAISLVAGKWYFDAGNEIANMISRSSSCTCTGNTMLHFFQSRLCALKSRPATGRR